MALTTRKTNDPPTPMEAHNLGRIIRSLQSDLSHNSSRITEEKEHAETCFKAIQNLNHGIAESLGYLRTHDAYLKRLVDLRESLPDIMPRSDLVAEPHSVALCDAAREHAVSINKRRVSIMESEMALVVQEEEELAAKLEQMEKELKGWKLGLETSNDLLKDLIYYKRQTTEKLEKAKVALSPIRYVPAEMWIQIFLLVVSLEYLDSFQGIQSVILRPTALILSQVCIFWRKVVRNEPRLWKFAFVHAREHWTKSEYDHFRSLIDRSGYIALVCNLSHPMRWYNYRLITTEAEVDEEKDDGDARSDITADTNRDGRTLIMVTPRTESISGKTYDLHLHMSADQHAYIQNTSYIPFQNPGSLIISSSSPFSNSHLLHLLPEFPTTHHLTLRNVSPQILPSEDLFAVMPSLTTVDLDLGTLPPNFALESFLSPRLKALNIRHNGQGIINEPDSMVHLPNLCWLGITASHTNFFKNLRFPALHSLVFYGPRSLTDIATPSGDAAEEIYAQLDHLQFHDWVKPDMLDEFGVVPELIKLVKKLTMLKCLTISDSFVDGGALLLQLNSQGSKEDAPATLHLDELTLSGTTGVTRDECEKLSALVDKLNVYV